MVSVADKPVLDVTVEEWEQYLEARRRRATLPPRMASPVNRLSGVVRCTACGNRMTVNRYLHQKDRFKCGNRACLSPTSIQIENAEAAVQAWLPTVATLVDAAAASAEPVSTASAEVERDRLARSASEAERALTQLTIDWARRVIPESAYIGARDALVAQRDAAAGALQKIARQSVTTKGYSTSSAALLADWHTLAPADCSLILQELAIVWVGRPEPGDRPGCTVRGLWEDQPDTGVSGDPLRMTRE